MKALVTGGSGFVGRHMIEALDKRGWDTVNIDVANNTIDALEFFEDRHDCFDLVVHCAYRVGGRVGIDGRNNNFAHNLQLDSKMFEWAYNTNQSAVMYFSSCAAYPAYLQYQSDRFMSEVDLNLDAFWGDPSIPFDNYGWAKQTGERLAKHYGDMGLRVHVLRPFSGYGEDQSVDYPFPAILKRAIDNDPTVWGPKEQTRDWIYIDDIINGALAVYDNDERRPVNLCTGVGTTMGELMYQARKELWFTDRLKSWHCELTYDTSKPTGALYRVGDPTRMNEHYTAKITLEEGVRRAYGRL